MDAQKLHVKFYAAPEHSPELEAFVPVLHDWIKKKALDELLIDVADYSHVHNGPGVVLIGHAADYYLDVLDGRLGLTYSKKRLASPPFQCFKDAFRRALAACALLEKEQRLDVRFESKEALIRIVDRLAYANDDSSFERIKPELHDFLGNLYAGEGLTTERVVGQPKELLTIRVRCPGAPGLETLLQRLQP